MTKSMTILYPIRDSLYVNLTNRCSCNCTFCLRQFDEGAHGSDPLWLDHEPSFDEVMKAFGGFDMGKFKEVVFCGYGEPTCAFELLKRVAAEVKERYGLKVRINTNGQGSLINGRDITPELEGLVDALSISLNTPDAGEYLELTRSSFGAEAFNAMLEFARDARRYVPEVSMTTVETTITPEQEDECASICRELGVGYRIRPWVD